MPKMKNPKKQIDESKFSNTSMSLGEYLRFHREDKNLSRKRISQYTKIISSNLELLEDDKLDELPNKAYVIGYVKSYSKILGLKEKDCLELLEKTYEKSPGKKSSLHSPSSPPPAPPPPLPSSSIAPSSSLFPRITLIVSVLVIVFLGSFLIFQGMKKQPAPRAPKIAPSQKPSPPKQTSTIAPQILSEKSPLVPVSSPPPKKEDIALREKKEEKEEEKKEEKNYRFYPLKRKLYHIENEISQTQIDQWLPQDIQEANVEGMQNLFINALEGSSWLAYKIDDKAIKKFVLKKEKNLFLRGKEILLTLGNASVVKIFLNNQLLAIDSKRGVRNLVFPQEVRQKYAAPLFIHHENGISQLSIEYIKEKEIEVPFLSEESN